MHARAPRRALTRAPRPCAGSALARSTSATHIYELHRHLRGPPPLDSDHQTVLLDQSDRVVLGLADELRGHGLGACAVGLFGFRCSGWLGFGVDGDKRGFGRVDLGDGEVVVSGQVVGW